MTGSDANRLADVLENRERYVKELENQAFGFTDDGNRLVTHKAARKLREFGTSGAKK